jgi:hypothetical protein
MERHHPGKRHARETQDHRATVSDQRHPHNQNPLCTGRRRSALWVLWENVYHETTKLPENFLLPPDANILRFRLYQAGIIFLWYFVLFCGLLLAGIGVVCLIRFAATSIRAQKYRALVLLFFLIYLIIGLGIFDDYGFLRDEATQRQIGLMKVFSVNIGGANIMLVYRLRRVE